MRSGERSGGAAADPQPLTLGTAGHVDHGKTALVRALTGVDTDRLPEERERGISIALGYAALELPSGRRVSVVDAPGHERFVRTMVSGATGVDFFLMTIAADDGVMPQTREHADVLRRLGVDRGVVAITKCDLADPELARAAADELLPGLATVAVSARTGAGLDELRSALETVAASLRSRAAAAGPPRLHIDRAFSIRGAGTIVTGTLWSGTIQRGDLLRVLPSGRDVRVRAVQIHGERAEVALAGQRVAVNLTGVNLGQISRGELLTSRDSGIRPTYFLDAMLDADLEPSRVHVYHGTREAPARVVHLGERFHQLRMERPLIPVRGDRLVIRSVAPPAVLAGGTVLDPRARKHGARQEVLDRLRALERGGEVPAAPTPRPVAKPAPAAAPAPLSPEALALEEQLRSAGYEPPLDRDLDPASLAALREAGRAVRAGRTMHFHRDTLADVEQRVRALIEAEGAVTLARLRDELGTSRKFAQSLLEHFDAAHLTVRRPDDSRTLRRRPAADEAPASDRGDDG